MSNSNAAPTNMAPTLRSILELPAKEAEQFLLKPESYCSIDLPPYFRFEKVLSKVYSASEEIELPSILRDDPRNYEDVNHLILNNKDGRHAWRPLQLIHPALYVSLVKKLTEPDNWDVIRSRFDEFENNENIKCYSIPCESLTEEKDKAEQVTHWWDKIEQKSIELALDYEFIIHADIENCYGAIYTHSIAWAIHSKSYAKKNRTDISLIGNIIDHYIMNMCHGQTNGIPQGSVLMDFIAEMVLGYADLELTQKIKEQNVENYLILRYRDDYRIFTNNPQDGENILKCLTEVLIQLGLRLHTEKTKICSFVINESIKNDKLAWMRRKQRDKSIQNHLLIIYNHSLEHPNSGSVVVALKDLYERLMRYKTNQHPMPLISIAVDIAYRNPRTYPICSAILSKLLSFIESKEEMIGVVEKIVRKFSHIPNTGHMEIWLQRICLKFAPDMIFSEPLCMLALDINIPIWNNYWISSQDLKNALDAMQIYDRDKANSLDPIVSIEEVELFMSRSEY